MNKDKIFFTSDLHLNHANCIKYDNRPFKDVKEMNKAIVDNWNKVVPYDGHVFLEGDIGFSPLEELERILYSLNGKIYLIQGNHDKHIIKNSKIRNRFVWIKDYYELTVQDQDVDNNKQVIIMCHYALRVWNMSHYGQNWNLYGHSHDRMKDQGKQYDVGVNGNNYTPVSYNQIKEIMKTRPMFDQVTKQIIEEDNINDSRRDRVIKRHNLKTCNECGHIIKE